MWEFIATAGLSSISPILLLRLESSCLFLERLGKKGGKKRRNFHPTPKRDVGSYPTSNVNRLSENSKSNKTSVENNGLMEAKIMKTPILGQPVDSR